MASRNRTATEADMDKLKSKIDKMDQKIDHAVMEVLKRFDNTASKDDVVTINNHLNRITAVLESLSGKMSDQHRTILVYDAILGKNQEQLDDHQRRLVSLESDAG